MTTNIGFIGIGVMGKSIVKHLLQAGHTVYIYTRTKVKAAELFEMGAEWCETPAEVSSKARYVFTMVGYPKDVEEIYFGDNGVFSATPLNQVLIDMTTSEPTLAKKIAERAQELGMSALDAPVSGGDIGAKNGKLSIMVGGKSEVYDEVLPLFQLFGENIQYQGKAGAGQHTKMCNQIAIATNMIGVCEAIVYGERAGLDVEHVLQSITTGAAGSWSLSNLAPRIIKEDFAPGFYIKHFVKDMKIALDEAERMNLSLPGLALAKGMYEELIAKGYENDGTQALIKSY